MNNEDRLLLEEIKEAIPNEKKYASITMWIFIAFALVWILVLSGIISIDYNVLFLSLSVLTGVYWYKEKKVWKKYLKKNKENEWVRPWWLSWTAGVFPIILIAFLGRGFLIEPFKVPTGSMIPNIMIGEIITTNKIYYHLKVPVLDKVLFNFNEVKRGDVVVFKYPPNPTIYYVKRFIGLPGDIIEYKYVTKTLKINDKEIIQSNATELNAGNKQVIEYQENLLGLHHSIWIEPSNTNFPDPQRVTFPLKDNCEYSLEKVICKVPKGYYFAMGDNRDNSADSRYWGFVPEENVVGKAQSIIFSPIGLNRLGWIK